MVVFFYFYSWFGLEVGIFVFSGNSISGVFFMKEVYRIRGRECE